MANKKLSEVIKEYKLLLIIVIVGFFLIEIEIFAVAVMKSGRQSWMNVLDDSGELIYQVKGSTLTNFNKYYFENTFGSIDDYQVRLVTKDVPFPFRAWLAAAIGVPVGLLLLLAFILKAVMVLLYGKTVGGDYDEAQHELYEKEDPLPNDGINNGTGMDKSGKSRKVGSGKGPAALPGSAENIFNRLSRLNIFIIGFLILSGVLLYVIIPDLLSFLARVGIDTILNFKWFFLGVFAVLLLLFVWFMYMRYQLAKKSIDAQTEIRKYEIKMEYARYDNALPAPDDYASREEPRKIDYRDVPYEDFDNK
ncbi:MAG: hypothetical protein HQK66_10470 [Desulfamplus sp.]|nr:hypothetical protein [Desulfamplus sp.]